MQKGPNENFMVDRQPYGPGHPDWQYRLTPRKMLDWGPRTRPQELCGGRSITESAKAGCVVCKRKLGQTT